MNTKINSVCTRKQVHEEKETRKKNTEILLTDKGYGNATEVSNLEK